MLLAGTGGSTLLTIVVLSPWATLAFASSAVSFSWFMLGSIIAVLATAVVLPSALVGGRWWRRLVAWRAMLFSLVAWLALMVEALAVSYVPGWLAVLAAAASGALNALLWAAPAGRHRARAGTTARRGAIPGGGAGRARTVPRRRGLHQ